MKALVIYDSVFGNTEQIAQAIGAALGLQPGVGILRVNEVKLEQLSGLEVLIAGSPTRGFRPTPAMSQLLGSIPGNGLQGARVAAFDTRIPVSTIKSPVLRLLVKGGGYAAKPMADRLKKCGGNQVLPPEGFYVQAEKGPLLEGELDRAAAWANQLISTGEAR